MRDQESIRRTFGFFLLVALAVAGAVSVTVYVRKGGSAGSPVGRSGGLEVWRLDSVPLMSVGDNEADPLHEVVGITITPRHVVIAQQSAGTLRFYDRRGSLDNVVGGRGEGPGEFGELVWMRGVADHLFTYDRYGRKVSRFSLDGRSLGSVALSPPEEYLARVFRRWGCFRTDHCWRISGMFDSGPRNPQSNGCLSRFFSLTVRAVSLAVSSK